MYLLSRSSQLECAGCAVLYYDISICVIQPKELHYSSILLSQVPKTLDRSLWSFVSFVTCDKDFRSCGVFL